MGTIKHPRSWLAACGYVCHGIDGHFKRVLKLLAWLGFMLSHSRNVSRRSMKCMLRCTYTIVIE